MRMPPFTRTAHVVTAFLAGMAVGNVPECDALPLSNAEVGQYVHHDGYCTREVTITANESWASKRSSTTTGGWKNGVVVLNAQGNARTHGNGKGTALRVSTAEWDPDCPEYTPNRRDFTPAECAIRVQHLLAFSAPETLERAVQEYCPATARQYITPGTW